MKNKNKIIKISAKANPVLSVLLARSMNSSAGIYNIYILHLKSNLVTSLTVRKTLLLE